MRRRARLLNGRREGTLRGDYVPHGRRLDTDVLSLAGAELDRALA